MKAAADGHVVEVKLASRSYGVHVGAGQRHRLPELMPDGARRAAVITQQSIGWSIDSGLRQTVFTLPDGEAAKSLAEVERLCSEMSRAGFTRADVVVALGGGVVTDVAGFVAAVYHRGIGYVSVPTTLLGQIDAAIGGKTGVNLPEGKNLIGAFWQPHAVVCDSEFLATLPVRELRSGQGELAKYHFLADSGIAGGHHGNSTSGTGEPSLDDPLLESKIAAAVKIKAGIVSTDEREGGLRAVLNYGHTLAHAIETVGRYDFRHGEAVAVGLVYAAEVAQRLGRIDHDRVDEHRHIVDSYDLPTCLPAGLSDVELLGQFGRDKKAINGLTMVLDSVDGVTPVTGIAESVLRDALSALR